MFTRRLAKTTTDACARASSVSCRRGLGVGLATLLVGCSTPGSIVAPPDAAMHLASPETIRLTTHRVTQVYPGDTLRIVRDNQDFASLDIRNLVEDSQTLLYVVRNDGSFSYRYIGRVDGTGKTPDELAAEMKTRLAPFYREPGVTINVVLSPSSKVIIGGAVRQPAALDLNAVATVEQAIFASGGLLSSADSRVIALLRLDANDRYQVYFIDFQQLLAEQGSGRPTFGLERGDILFVPKSTAGNAADAVDLYFNQLIPFTRTLGVSFGRNFD